MQSSPFRTSSFLETPARNRLAIALGRVFTRPHDGLMHYTGVVVFDRLATAGNPRAKGFSSGAHCGATREPALTASDTRWNQSPMRPCGVSRPWPTPACAKGP